MKQSNEQFPTSDHCLDYIWQMHYTDQPCNVCGLSESFHKLPSRPAYQCQCGAQVYPLANTPFHKSTTDLRTWFLAIFFMTNTRSGMSAMQFQRISGVTYKTAWRIFKQVRLMMTDDGTPLSNDVEVDEAYIHPNPARNTRLKPKLPGKRFYNSEIVFGMVERGGRARIKHVKSSGTRVLLPEIQKNIESTATIYSDEYGSYRLLRKRGYEHQTVNHSSQQYVIGRVHTQMSRTSGASSSGVSMASIATLIQFTCSTTLMNMPFVTATERTIRLCLPSFSSVFFRLNP